MNHPPLSLRHTAAAWRLFAFVAFSLITINECLAQKKWHPGHNLPSNSVATYHRTDIAAIAEANKIRGAIPRFCWADLEPSESVYDFSKFHDSPHHTRAINTPSQPKPPILSASSELTLNGFAHFKPSGIARNGSVTINGNSPVNSTVISDRLTINRNGLLH